MTKLTFYGFQIEWYNKSDKSLMFDEWCDYNNKNLEKMYAIYSKAFDKMEKISVKLD